jgi:hypothetical protein
MPKKQKLYFNSIADILHFKAQSAGVFSGKSDIGKCREIISQNFLQKHVPPRFSVHLGGDIFGLPNECSGQIDIIINHDMCASFKEHSLIRCPVESVIAAVSIKSKLDKAQIYDGLKNLASIPQLNQNIISTGPFTKPVNLYIQSWPSLYLFAFDGIRKETCVEHIVAFYQEHNYIPFNRRPRAIIVNKKYCIAQINYEDETPPGTIFLPKYSFTVLNFDTQGSALFWMIIEISKGISWLNGMYLDYNEYYKTAYNTP